MAFRERGRARVIDVEQGDALAVQLVGFGRVVLVFGNRREIAEDLRAHPQDRGDLAAAHRLELGVGAVERVGRPGEVIGQPQRRAAQLQRLAVEDLGLLGRKQLVGLLAELLADLRIGVEALGGGAIDVEPGGGARLGLANGLGERRVELGQRTLGVALVELMDRAIIAQAPGDDRVGADLLGGALEQRIGLGITAEIGFLQRFVGEPFGAAQSRDFAGVADGGEELGGLGIAAGIVAAIGLGQRLGRIERPRLHPGEGRRIADAGGGDRNLALDQLVGDDAPEAQLKRAVVTGEALGGVKQLALAQVVDPVADVGVLELAVDRLDLAEALDRRRGGGRAGHLAGAGGGEAGRAARPIAQLVHLADRQRRIAAGDRIAGIEHVGQRLVGGDALG